MLMRVGTILPDEAVVVTIGCASLGRSSLSGISPDLTDLVLDPEVSLRRSLYCESRLDCRVIIIA